MTKPWEASFVNDGVSQAAPVHPRDTKPWEWEYVEGEQENAPSVRPPPRIQEEREPARFDMDTYIDRLAMVESSGNPNARNPQSTATGLFQFTAPTWNDWVNRLGLDYTPEDRTDPDKSRVVLEGFTRYNKERIQNIAGRTPSNVDVYMTHLLGSTGGLRMISAPRSAPAHQHATGSQVKANRSLFYTRKGRARTVGEFMKQFEERFNG